jgi:hypothetical protein
VIGSPAIAALFAQLAFWALLFWGWATGEIQTRGIVFFVALWLAAYVGMPYVAYGAALFPPVVALIDIILVLVIFKGDVILS